MASHVLLHNRVPSVDLLHDCCRHHNKLADALSNEALDGVGWDGGLKLPNVSSSQMTLLHPLGGFSLAALHVTIQTVRPRATENCETCNSSLRLAWCRARCCRSHPNCHRCCEAARLQPAPTQPQQRLQQRLAAAPTVASAGGQPCHGGLALSWCHFMQFFAATYVMQFCN